MKKFKNDDQNNLDSVGFDTNTFDEITEQEIREYFRAKNWTQMVGTPVQNGIECTDDWNEYVDFESYIEAAIDVCSENGSLK